MSCATIILTDGEAGQLVAFVETAQGHRPAPAALRQFLIDQLPPHMVLGLLGRRSAAELRPIKLRLKQILLGSAKIAVDKTGPRAQVLLAAPS